MSTLAKMPMPTSEKAVVQPSREPANSLRLQQALDAMDQEVKEMASYDAKWQRLGRVHARGVRCIIEAMREIMGT